MSPLQLWRWRCAARAHTAAAAGLAELAGQNSAAMGADTVVDLLARTAPLLSIDDRPPLLSSLAGWRLALAEATCREASYVGVVLARWQMRHNSGKPELATDVDLSCVDAAGTAVISARQARELERSLDGLGLKGAVLVRAARTGPSWTLLIGEHEIVITAEAALEMPSRQPGSVAGWLQKRHRRRHEAAIGAAFRRGRNEVIELSEMAAAEVRRAYSERRHHLDPTLEVEVARRLAETDRRLAALRPGAAQLISLAPQRPPAGRASSHRTSRPARRTTRRTIGAAIPTRAG